MVNRMPGSNVYGSTSGTASRSRTPPSLGAGGKGSHSTHTTASARTTSTHTTASARTTSTHTPGFNFSNSSKKNANDSSTGRFGGSGSRDTITPAGSGIENSYSNRSTGSASGSGSARKMNRGSFRRTMMLQKSKRNSVSNATNGDTNETKLGAKTLSPEGLPAAPAANQISNARSANPFQSNRRFFRGNVVGAVIPSTVEEREAGASSPTIPQPNAPHATCNGESSSSLSAAVHPQRQSQSESLIQKQSPQERITGKVEERPIGEELPRGHVDTILRFYGGDKNSPASFDLYRDVLKVSPEASDREIRIAYFRRGREILGDNGSKTDQTYTVAKAKATKLDPATKSRFQAVSMAYEILSTPSYKMTYLRQGGLLKKQNFGIKNKTNSQVSQNSTGITLSAEGDSTQSSEFDPFSSSPSTVAAAFPNSSSVDDGRLQKMESVITATTSKLKNDAAQERQIQTPQRLPTALRKSSFTGRGENSKSSPWRSRPSTQGSSSLVRWKDHVEELVFANHPNEHASDDDSDSDHNSNNEDNIPEDDDILEEEELRKNGHQSGRGRMSADSLDTSIRSTADANTNDSYGDSSRSRRRKKKKPKIVIDSDELESHLKRMDNEAEKHFVQDFWDNFEESMDGILSLVDSLGVGGDSAKGTTNRNSIKSSSIATPFSNASSWLSPASSINSTSASQRLSYTRGNRDAADTTIGRSLSHDLTISSKSIAEDDVNNEGLMKRSNSFPLSSSSPSTWDAVSPSPLPSKSNRLGSPSAAGSVVTPDEKVTTAAKSASNSGVSSHYETMLNSWPFQSTTPQEEENVQENQQQTTSLTVTSPAVVSPSPKSKSIKTSVKNKGGLSVSSTDLDATTSVASSILSTTQRRQKFFRPISPTSSEASEVITCDLVPVSSSSPSNEKDGFGNVDANAESNQFELKSNLSEMENLDLTELNNPFRRGGPSSSSSPTGIGNAVLPTSSTDRDVSDVPSNINNSVIKGQKKKKNRFRVSMMSRIRGSSTKKQVFPSHDPIQSDKSSTCSGTSKSWQSMEDVFAGVEDDSQLLQQYDMADGEKLKLQDISIERSASHMSDLSGSIFSSKTMEENGEAVTNEFAGANPSSETLANESTNVNFDPSMTTNANSVLNSTAGRSQGSTGYSSFTSSTQGDTKSVHSIESTGAETPAFFEYFIAYVTAVMTECANLGSSSGVAEYHQDFLGLFSNDTSACNAEIREQPSSMRRVPSETTRSTLSS